MSKINIAYFNGDCGYIALVDEYTGGYLCEIKTSAAHCGHYVRIDDGHDYPQLCAGGSTRGNALTWARDEHLLGQQLAVDCDARLYKTRRGYDKALKTLKEKEY